MRVPHHRHPPGRILERSAYAGLGGQPAAVVGHQHRGRILECFPGRGVEPLDHGRSASAVQTKQRLPAGSYPALDRGAALGRQCDDSHTDQQVDQAVCGGICAQRGQQDDRPVAAGGQQRCERGSTGTGELMALVHHGHGCVGAQPLDGADQVDVEHGLAHHHQRSKATRVGHRPCHRGSIGLDGEASSTGPSNARSKAAHSTCSATRCSSCTVDVAGALTDKTA